MLPCLYSTCRTLYTLHNLILSALDLIFLCDIPLSGKKVRYKMAKWRLETMSLPRNPFLVTCIMSKNSYGKFEFGVQRKDP